MWFCVYSLPPLPPLPPSLSSPPPPSPLSITILGTGAKWLWALEERGVSPMNTHKLTSLHTILSTGSPLKPQSYDYVYSHIKNNLLLGSITGT